MTEKEKAVVLYTYWKNLNEKTKTIYGHENRIALAGMKLNEWAINKK